MTEIKFSSDMTPKIKHKLILIEDDKLNVIA